MERVLFNDNWMIKKMGDSHEFSLKWEKVVVPHDAVIGTLRNADAFNGTKKAFFENGAWEYVKTFDAPKNWQGKDVFIEFQGVYNHAMVYVNGNFIGKHAYGYTEFTVNISKYLLFGEKNVIKVVCRTNDDSRWYTGAGLYRDVNFLVANKLHIKNNGIKITTLSASDNKATLEVAIELSQIEEVTINADIIFADKVVATYTQAASKSGKFNIEIDKPMLWSVETPNLYTCCVSITDNGTVIDTATETFGIRTMSVNAKEGLRINGQSVKLRGACIHHDNGVIGVRTFKSAEYRRIQKLKDAGFNAIRSAHQPASRYTLEACDRLGMLVMDEAFDVWQTPKSSDDYANDFNENWKNDIKAMVDKDYNHPSVIMYSIGNEISDLATKAGVSLANEIAKETKSLDGSRYTTVAINGLLLLMNKMEVAKQLSGEGQEEPKKDINEAMSSLDDVMVRINNTPSMDAIIQGGCDAVDIAGYNYMHNRYEPDIEKYPDRVIVGSETYAKYIADMWRHIETHDNVIGDFTWTGWDYIGETGIGNVAYEARDYHQGFYGVYPCITAACGDIDITGFRLAQSYYREIVFDLRKEPYIAVHNPAMVGKTEYLSTWGWGDVVSSWSFDGYENTPLTVDVYAKGAVELLLNGKSMGTKAVDSNYKCSFTVPYKSGTIEAVTIVDGREYRYLLQRAAKECLINLSAENDNVQVGELAFINIALTDEKGNIHYGKDKLITLSVAGGELIGFGSGASKTEESYTDNTHTTYNGRAFAVILTNTAGKITVTAEADGLQKKEITISVK